MKTMKTNDETTTWRRDPHLPFQRLDEDTIVVDPGRREVHLLNETAARLWELLESPRSVDDLVAILSDEYEASTEDVRLATSALVRELGAKGVLLTA